MSYPEIANKLREKSDLAEVVLCREITSRLPQAVLGVMRERSNPVAQLKELLGSEEMNDLIEAGHITIGMIKPRLDQHIDLSKVEVDFPNDTKIVNDVMSMINSPLEVLATVSMRMSPEMVEEFYVSSKPNMQREESDGRTTWQHFHELMASGPVTFMVIGSPEGNAIELWRQKIGRSWDVTRSQPGQFRNLMKSNANNGFHGSDKIQAVKDELNFIARHMI